MKNKISAKDNFVKCQDLVKKFLKPEKIIWGREIKIAKELLSLYGADFFNDFSLEFKLNSLAFLKSEAGLGYILDFKTKRQQTISNNRVLDELTKTAPEFKIENNKIGDDIKFKKKNSSLMEFLDMDYD